MLAVWLEFCQNLKLGMVPTVATDPNITLVISQGNAKIVKHDFFKLKMAKFFNFEVFV